MNYWLGLGILFGIIAIVVVIAIAQNIKVANNYKRAVRAYLGDDWELYWDEKIFFDFLDANMYAADCAREMIAANCED